MLKHFSAVSQVVSKFLGKMLAKTVEAFLGTVPSSDRDGLCGPPRQNLDRGNGGEKYVCHNFSLARPALSSSSRNPHSRWLLCISPSANTRCGAKVMVTSDCFLEKSLDFASSLWGMAWTYMDSIWNEMTTQIFFSDKLFILGKRRRRRRRRRWWWWWWWWWWWRWWREELSPSPVSAVCMDYRSAAKDVLLHTLIITAFRFAL